MIKRREGTSLMIVNDSDEDERLPLLSCDSDQQQQEQNERLIPSPEEEVEQGAITSANENETTTKFALSEYVAEPSLIGSLRCAAMPARYVVAIWAFFGFLCLYALRVNISLAIVAMVPPQSALNQSVRSCPISNTSSPKPSSNYEFDWKPSTQEFILGAFFYGYILSQVIGGDTIKHKSSSYRIPNCFLIFIVRQFSRKIRYIIAALSTDCLIVFNVNFNVLSQSRRDPTITIANSTKPIQ
ncbi:unnamed protein product [Rotaria sordida]|uniref:Uncharacterized protein n=1 Tax=Rotaria sordida TaxID=392033 RepID=A0A818ZP41_9BILA|nr:unnamed protein product [Rotaria sordida]